MLKFGQFSCQEAKIFAYFLSQYRAKTSVPPGQMVRQPLHNAGSLAAGTLDRDVDVVEGFKNPADEADPEEEKPAFDQSLWHADRLQKRSRERE